MAQAANHSSVVEHVEPSRRAFEAAISMEIHAACSTQTVGKARELDRHFPAYDDMLAAGAAVLDYATLPEILANNDRHEDTVFAIRIGDLRRLNAAIAKAEGRS